MERISRVRAAGTQPGPFLTSRDGPRLARNRAIDGKHILAVRLWGARQEATHQEAPGVVLQSRAYRTGKRSGRRTAAAGDCGPAAAILARIDDEPPPESFVGAVRAVRRSARRSAFRARGTRR